MRYAVLMPFAGYEDFDDCVAQNSDKDDPGAYCAAIKQAVEGLSAQHSGKRTRLQLQIVPVLVDEFAEHEGEDGWTCPMSTTDGALNAENRDIAIAAAGYGPRDPSEPEDEFWQGLADLWEIPADAARERSCGSCAAFVQTTPMLDCIASGAGASADEWQAIEAGDLGYCSQFDFVCSSRRVCGAWTEGGPVADETPVEIEIEGGAVEIEAIDALPEEGVEVVRLAAEDAATFQAQAGDDFHALLVVEGIWTGDGRWIEEGALTWRDLPLPLMASDRTTDGHMDARLIGQITRIEREGREIHGYGTFIPTEDDDVLDLQRLVRLAALRGISVDLDAMTYELLVDRPEEARAEDVSDDGYEDIPGDETDGYEGQVLAVEDMRMRVTAARIMGATVVPFPAFQEAYIESLPALVASLAERSDLSGWIERYASFADIDFQPPQGAREEAEKGLAWRREYERGGTAVGVARARDIANGRNLSPDTVRRMASYFARHEIDKDGEGWSPGEDGFPSAGRIAWALWGGDPGRTWAEKVVGQMASREAQGSVVASAAHPVSAPVVPPAEFFTNPNLLRPTALTVTNDGRVFGHAAIWGQCHIGINNECRPAPRSAANYGYFLTGEIVCEDGSRHPVGQITLGTGHAPIRMSAAEAARHYDHTGTAVADITTGEDRHGIWMSGALRPGLDPATIRVLMASGVSGDWRNVRGNLELVGLLSVNVPGFPVVRVREAEGLVASLLMPAVQIPAEQSSALDPVIDRLASTIGRSRRERVAALAARLGRTPDRRVAELAARVKG